MPGKAIDGYTKDATNMGAAMALGAFDSISAFFSENREDDFDLVALYESHLFDALTEASVTVHLDDHASFTCIEFRKFHKNAKILFSAD